MHHIWLSGLCTNSQTDDTQDRFPEVSKVLKENMYVDDALVGTHSVKEAIQIREDLQRVLKSAGFIIKKWTANHIDILKNVPKTDLLREDFLDLEAASLTKTLGVRWDASKDEFFFRVSAAQVQLSYTKREILSAIAKLFDPAGWISPVIVKAKILMQRIWQENGGWDDPVGAGILGNWQDFLRTYTGLSEVRLPRWVHTGSEGRVEFYGFSDASERAYAAAIYVRVQTGPNSWTTNLLISKTRVAPLKTVSLPRIELCGAVLLTTLASSLVGESPLFQVPMKYWSDSTIVLAWIKKPPSTWTTFVANRVTQIQEATDITQCSHVDSSDNPADISTRGMTPQELISSSLCWHGPKWRSEDERCWPQPESAHKERETELEGGR